MAGSSPTFTAGQRLHLEVIFGSLISETEDLIDWAQRTAAEEGPDRQGWWADLRGELSSLLMRLRETAVSIDISVRRREEDPRRKLAAWSSTWWAHVLDCRPDALKAYGSVDPSLKPLLDPAIQEIAQRLLHIEHAAEQAR